MRISLNVNRTRITVLGFTLTMILFATGLLIAVEGLQPNPERLPEVQPSAELLMSCLYWMGGLGWFVIIYVGPVFAVFRAPLSRRQRVMLLCFYAALVLLVFWIQALGYHVWLADAGMRYSMVELFLCPLVDVFTKRREVTSASLTEAGRQGRQISPRQQVIHELQVRPNPEVAVGFRRRQSTIIDEETQIAENGAYRLAVGIGTLEIVG